MKSKKLTLHKSTIRQLGSESLKTFKGGGSVVCTVTPMVPAPAPAAPRPHHRPYTEQYKTQGTQCLNHWAPPSGFCNHDNGGGWLSNTWPHNWLDTWNTCLTGWCYPW